MVTFLWCVPRSISSAFEKMMWHSGLFEVKSEPFIDHYKQSRLSEQDFEAATQSVRHYCDSLIEQSAKKTVFVKDMGYHAEPFITDEIIQSVRHTFLIRDPLLTIPSLYKMRPDYDEAHTGFAGQLALFERIQKVSGHTPLIIDAQQLTNSPQATVQNYFEYLDQPMPADLLNWPKGSRPEWSDRESWHLDAIQSERFENHSQKPNFADLPNKVKASIERDTPIYQQMLAHC